MRKRNKKYNPLKSLQTAATWALRGLCVRRIVADGDDGKCELVDYVKGRSEPVTPNVMRAIKDLRHKWSYLMVTFEQESNGKIKTLTDWLHFGTEVLQAEVADALDNYHRQMQCERTIGFAWLAFPAPNWELSEENDAAMAKKLLPLLEVKK